MDGDGYTNDPFEKEQRRLKRLFDELSSGSEHEESDPYEDEGEYGSDQDYVPNENSSESDVENDKADLSANSEADSDTLIVIKTFLQVHHGQCLFSKLKTMRTAIGRTQQQIYQNLTSMKLATV